MPHLRRWCSRVLRASHGAERRAIVLSARFARRRAREPSHSSSICRACPRATRRCRSRRRRCAAAPRPTPARRCGPRHPCRPCPRSSTSRRSRTSAGACATTISSHGSLSRGLDEQRHVVDDDGAGSAANASWNCRSDSARTAGWTIALSRVTARGRRTPGAEAPPGRASRPGAASPSPNSAAIAASTGDPGCCTSRTTWSASTIDGTVLGEAAGDRGLARGDASGERDEWHPSRMPCRHGCRQRLRTLGTPEADLSLA